MSLVAHLGRLIDKSRISVESCPDSSLQHLSLISNSNNIKDVSFHEALLLIYFNFINLELDIVYKKQNNTIHNRSLLLSNVDSGITHILKSTSNDILALHSPSAIHLANINREFLITSTNEVLHTIEAYKADINTTIISSKWSPIANNLYILQSDGILVIIHSFIKDDKVHQGLVDKVNLSQFIDEYSNKENESFSSSYRFDQNLLSSIVDFDFNSNASGIFLLSSDGSIYEFVNSQMISIPIFPSSNSNYDGDYINLLSFHQSDKDLPSVLVLVDSLGTIYQGLLLQNDNGKNTTKSFIIYDSVDFSEPDPKKKTETKIFSVQKSCIKTCRYFVQLRNTVYEVNINWTRDLELILSNEASSARSQSQVKCLILNPKDSLSCHGILELKQASNNSDPLYILTGNYEGYLELTHIYGDLDSRTNVQKTFNTHRLVEEDNSNVVKSNVYREILELFAKSKSDNPVKLQVDRNKSLSHREQHVFIDSLINKLISVRFRSFKLARNLMEEYLKNIQKEIAQQKASSSEINDSCERLQEELVNMNAKFSCIEERDKIITERIKSLFMRINYLSDELSEPEVKIRNEIMAISNKVSGRYTKWNNYLKSNTNRAIKDVNKSKDILNSNKVVYLNDLVENDEMNLITKRIKENSEKISLMLKKIELIKNHYKI